MKTLYQFIILSFLCTSTFVQSQSKSHELGKVTVEELQKSYSSIDSSAVAEYLFLKGTYTVDFDEEGVPILQRTMEAKIKIYNKEGYNHATQMFSIYTGGRREINAVTNAFTYNLVNGKIERTKLKSDGEFTEKVNDKYDVKKFTMPNIKEGCIIEFKFTMKSAYEVFSFPEWFFQKSIPIVYNELVVVNPANFFYRSVLKPYLHVDKEDTVFEDYRGKMNKSIFKVNNAPAVKDEKFVSDMGNYIAAVNYELASVKYRDGSFKDYSVTWEDVSTSIYNDVFKKELSETNYFEEDLNAFLTKNNVQPNDKLMAVYTFVKEKMTWNDRYGYYVDKGVKKAYKEGVGNVGDINLMLISMLNHVGIKTRPVLLSTRNNGIPLYPTTKSFNYVIAAAKLPDGGYYLLDATSKNALPQILPVRCLNWTGRMIAEDGKSSEVDLMPVRPSKSTVNAMVTIQTDGSVKGKMRDLMTDYYAANFRDFFNNKTEQSIIEYIEKNEEGVEIESHKTNNKNDLSKPVSEEYEFVNNNSVEIIGDKMYVSPTLHFGFKTNPFKSDKREFPIDFSYPRNNKYLISLTIPEGYTVETLPESVILSFEEEMMGFKYQVSHTSNNIQIGMSIDYNVSIVSPKYYETLKAFFGKMAEKQSEQIVLKKL